MKTPYIQFCEIPGADEQLRGQLLQDVVAEVSVNYTQIELDKPFHISFLWDFLEWQGVTGMEAEQIIESLANYVRFLRVPNVICISNLLSRERRIYMDL